jgi:hypothetical protein
VRTRCLPAAAVALLVIGLHAQPAPTLPVELLGRAASIHAAEARPALAALERAWDPRYIPILLELAELSTAPDPAGPPPIDPADPAAPVQRPISPARERLVRFLEERTGQRFGLDFDRWHRWIWSRPPNLHPDYARFKGLLYANLDPRMRDFFPPNVPATIRLDEVVWGGVQVNGIPPLYYPKHLPAADATYLRDNHIVFGIAIDGEARAYPKRILAWHELAWDRIGGVELTIVYCTLCGTVIPYESIAGGELRRMGTSGLLYRSNKLMFDEGTRSLWSTLDGRPVIGPLVGSGLALTPRATVTTTWGEWRRRHPKTTVLSLDTGHQRDYSEGAAYRDYFGTDRLMFSVPSSDARLANKAEVLVLRVEPVGGGPPVPLAVSADFLRGRAVYQTEVAGRRLVIVTSQAGANRVYDAGDRTFAPKLDGDRLVDQDAARWNVTEDGLERAGGTPRPRLAAQRAFWFGWYAQYPDTLLVK